MNRLTLTRYAQAISEIPNTFCWESVCSKLIEGLFGMFYGMMGSSFET